MIMMIPIARCNECDNYIYREQDLYICEKCKMPYCECCWFNMEKTLDGICDKCWEKELSKVLEEIEG